LIHLYLTVNPTYEQEDTVTICDSQFPFAYGDTTFAQGTITGDYPVHFTTITGCDSVITLYLTVNPTYDNKDTVTICDSELPFAYGDTTFIQGTITGDYPVYFTTIHGCDSLITLYLTVNPTYDNKDTLTICDSQLPFSYGDTTFTQGTITGDYPVHLTTIHGCDSLINLYLTVNPTYDNKDTVTICDSELPFTYGDNVFAQGTITGDYLVRFTTIHGCDSLINLSLMVNPTYITPMADSICYGESYLFGGRELVASGIYYDTLQSIHGCDSVIALTLTIKSPVYVYLGQDTVIKVGDSIRLDAGSDFASYSWSTGETKPSIIVKGEQPDTLNVWVMAYSINNCIGRDTVQIIVVPLTNIFTLDKEPDNVKLYPNPTMGGLNIEFTDAKRRDIKIYDSDGRMLYQQTHNEQKIQLSLEYLAVGTYYITIDNTTSLQFVIVK
jgi:hypothetical protein